MAEDLQIIVGDKKTQYELLIPQIKALMEGETNLIANLANISAALKTQFNWWWVGFYWIDTTDLVLGPFQGPIACTRIKKGRGVCGACWEREKTVLVEDVEKFPGHIACSAASKSEIVVPVIQDGIIKGVLDVDSEFLAYFDEIDRYYLEKIVALIPKNY